MNSIPKITKMGERAILVQFEPEINEEVLKKVLVFQKLLQEKIVKEGVEITNTYNSLLVSYPIGIEDPYSLVSGFFEGISVTNIDLKLESQLFHIPVCYGEEFGPDLQEISEAKRLSKSEIIRLHSAPLYTVCFLGFLPGFLYLAGLCDKLHFPRRKHPRLEVPKGAVGIGEKQTGIYPQKSPGGWNIIGNSPVPLFDPYSDPPCEIKAGDKLRFFEVSLEEHKEIREKVDKGAFVYKKERYEG